MYRICENFDWVNQLPSIAEKTNRKIFCKCDKGRHILYAIFNTGQYFLLAIIIYMSTCTIVYHGIIYVFTTGCDRYDPEVPW